MTFVDALLQVGAESYVWQLNCEKYFAQLYPAVELEHEYEALPPTKEPEFKVLVNMELVGGHAPGFHRRVCDVQRGGLLFVTEGERVGSASKLVRSGDVIAIIKGLSVLAVLHPDGEGNRYRYIGPAYMAGVLGDDFDKVWERDEDGGQIIVLV
jgi:hypothetical protein